ncbi:MAG: RNA-binding protein [Nitrososphaerota archaeon]|jgi:small nuclear ribonucleoprotein|nr:LSm family protein [Nitrososphaerota archaeon]MDG7034744.1 RNA-binding protein [Nitrososphaerota archaeon]MDG7035773.1 RNA-binding protein [Nitrososphaerota archaeon]MDG7039454.1 RNA-binding protein [Nitrososphaerota archaeon]MDG7040930.1 RNA-binding protein [Nitrososphaerota archaeon]
MSADMTLKMLSDSLSKVVLIRLKGNKKIRGHLQGFDQHMNLLLSETAELEEDGSMKELGVVVVRGDNVILVSPLSN